MDPSPLPHNRDDDDLVRAAISGDKIAIEQLLRDNYARLYTLCHRICNSREQAEDATQNTLIAIVRGLPSFDRRSRFSTWSHRIASNSSIDELRRARRVQTETLEHDRSGMDVPASIHLEDLDTPSRAVGARGPSRGPEDHVIAVETRQRLSVALDQLDERFRVPMVLRDVAQLDYAEIAELLDLAPGTVRSRISRGRAALRESLRGTDLDPESQEPSGNQDAAVDVETERR